MKIQTKLFFGIILSFSALLSIYFYVATFVIFRPNVLDHVSRHFLAETNLKSIQIQSFIESMKRRAVDFSTDGLIIKCLDDFRIANGEGCTPNQLSEYLFNNKLPVFDFANTVLVLDLSGIVVGSTDVGLLGSDRSTRSEYLVGLNKSFFSDVHAIESKISEGFEFDVSAPIKSNGEAVGVVVSEIRVDELFKILLVRDGLGETGETYLVDAQGYFVTPSRFISDAVLKKNINELKKARCSGTADEGLETYVGYNGERVYGAAQDVGVNNWCIFVEMFESEVNSFSRNQVFMVLSVGTVSFILILIFSIWIGKSISKPIRRLQDTVIKVEKGDLSQRTNSTSKDEIGVLSRSFDVMAQVLSRERDELKEKSEAQAREKAKLMASINSLQLGFVLFGNDDEILVTNNALVKMFGLLSNISLKDRLNETFDIKALCNECRANQQPIEKTGIQFNNRYYRTFVNPVIERGTYLGTVVIIEDITDAKMLERSKDEFFAIASHELRTPLTAIRGNTALIDQYFGDKIHDPDLKEMLADMHESSVRLIDIVNDFLDVGRLEQGKVEFKLENFDLAEVLREVCHDLDKVASEKGLQLLCNDPARAAIVLADKGKTEQVVTNLIGNAIKYTKQGKVVVGIEDAGDKYILSVVDTGIGISKENQVRLFKKFSQASESFITRDVTRGTGLGLYISKLLANGMKADVKLASSELGKGSAFVFEVPKVVE